MAPGAYNAANMVDKKNEPRWTMAGRYKDAHLKNLGTSPAHYDIPSKMVESPGKTMGHRLISQSMQQLGSVPGPGSYGTAEKPKKGDYKYSMGGGKGRDEREKEGPGPGDYDLRH